MMTERDPVWDILEQQGRRQVWLAARAHISNSLVTRMKQGTRRATPTVRRRIAAALDLPEAVLFRPVGAEKVA
jgi:transcriptional regulator with XRE-family HTH domain